MAAAARYVRLLRVSTVPQGSPARSECMLGIGAQAMPLKNKPIIRRPPPFPPPRPPGPPFDRQTTESAGSDRPATVDGPY